MRNTGIIAALLMALITVMVASIHARAELLGAGLSLESRPGPYNPNEPHAMKGISDDEQSVRGSRDGA
jgi:hypothetical protein